MLLLEWLRSYRSRPKKGPYLPSQRLYSCFICFAHQDEEFARLLTLRLRKAGARVWFAPEDMKAGKKLHDEICKAIGAFDKFVLILSSHSMRSKWVEEEIRRARRKERQECCEVLFPIRLVPMEEIDSWKCFDSDFGEDMAVEIRKYLIPDFSNWKKSAHFERMVRQLINDLEMEHRAERAA